GWRERRGTRWRAPRRRRRNARIEYDETSRIHGIERGVGPVRQIEQMPELFGVIHVRERLAIALAIGRFRARFGSSPPGELSRARIKGHVVALWHLAVQLPRERRIRTIQQPTFGDRDDCLSFFSNAPKEADEILERIQRLAFFPPQDHFIRNAAVIVWT